MKAVKILTVVLIAAGLINWLRGGESFSIFKCLPLVSGNGKPAIYQLGGLAMLLVAAIGLATLQSRGGTSDADDVEYGPVENDGGSDEDGEDDADDEERDDEEEEE